MKNLKFILSILFFFYFPNNFKAQITIDGKVTDSDLNPISNALVEIIDQYDTTNNYSSTTDASGYFSISNIFTDLAERKNIVPSDFIILRNYPNPFNPSTIIYYELPKSENIEIKIYDILGRELRTLYNNFHKAGTYTLNWDGRNNWNSQVAAGIYFCRLKTKDDFKVHKMVFLDGGSSSASLRKVGLQKSQLQNVSKTNGIFNFSVKVTGNDILESDFKYLSCSGDTTINLIVPKILKSVTIGPEGGKLETDDFSLTIPEGAFLEDANLDLAIEPDTTSSAYELLSKYYRLDGMPDDYYKDLKIRIRLEKATNDSIYGAFGISDTVFILDENFVNFDFYSAIDSSGHAIVNLASPYGINGGLSNNVKIKKITKGSNIRRTLIALMSPGKVYSANNNFIIYYPKSKAIIVPIIDDYLESAVEVIKGLGFNKLPSRTEIFPSIWPIVVKLQSFSENSMFDKSKAFISVENGGLYEVVNNKYYLKKVWEIIINSNIEESDDFLSNLRRVIGRSVFALFIDQSYINIPENENYWLIASIPIWAEKMFPRNESHIPSLYDWNDEDLNKFKIFCKWNYALEILNGLPYKENKKIKKSIYNHFIAFSSLIEYLANNITKKEMVIIDIQNNILSKKSSVDGLIATMNETENIWWPNFFKEFIQSNIYNVPIDEFLKNITETIEFNDYDTLKYADKTYNDLSAKLFRININSEEIKNNKSLNFKLGPESLNLDYVKTLVFGIRNNNLVFISEGIDFSLGNLYQFDGLIACVVNSGNEPPYTGTSEIKLDIRAKEELQFNACKIEINVIGIWERHRIPPPPNTLPTIDTMGYRAEWNTLGNFTANTFEGVLEKNEYGAEAKGKVKIDLDGQLNISSLTVEAISHYDQENSQWECSSINIALQNKADWNMYFDVLGENTCNSLTKVYHYHESPPSITGVIPYSKLIDYYCDENSYIKVTLYKKSIP